MTDFMGDVICTVLREMNDAEYVKVQEDGKLIITVTEEYAAMVTLEKNTGKVLFVTLSPITSDEDRQVIIENFEKFYGKSGTAHIKFDALN